MVNLLKYFLASLLLTTGLLVANSTSAMNQPQITCKVCMDTYERNKFHRLSCGHSFCAECLTNVVEIGIKTKSIIQFRCPNFDCKKTLSLSDIRKVGIDNSKMEEIKEILNPKKISILTGLQKQRKQANNIQLLKNRAASRPSPQAYSLSSSKPKSERPKTSYQL